jgi:hypothetical protein
MQTDDNLKAIHCKYPWYIKLNQKLQDTFLLDFWIDSRMVKCLNRFIWLNVSLIQNRKFSSHDVNTWTTHLHWHKVKCFHCVPSEMSPSHQPNTLKPQTVSCRGQGCCCSLTHTTTNPKHDICPYINVALLHQPLSLCSNVHTSILLECMLDILLDSMEVGC